MVPSPARAGEAHSVAQRTASRIGHTAPAGWWRPCAAAATAIPPFCARARTPPLTPAMAVSCPHRRRHAIAPRRLPSSPRRQRSSLPSQQRLYPPLPPTSSSPLMGWTHRDAAAVRRFVVVTYKLHGEGVKATTTALAAAPTRRTLRASAGHHLYTFAGDVVRAAAVAVGDALAAAASGPARVVAVSTAPDVGGAAQPPPGGRSVDRRRLAGERRHHRRAAGARTRGARARAGGGGGGGGRRARVGGAARGGGGPACERGGRVVDPRRAAARGGIGALRFRPSGALSRSHRVRVGGCCAEGVGFFAGSNKRRRMSGSDTERDALQRCS